MKIKSLLVGASGLVGSEILKYLHERDQDITIFTRKPLHDLTDKHKEINIDFENLNNFDFPYFDHVYIAIGMKLNTVELIHSTWYIPDCHNSNTVVYTGIDVSKFIYLLYKHFLQF